MSKQIQLDYKKKYHKGTYSEVNHITYSVINHCPSLKSILYKLISSVK